jgi:hypothetical protein
MKPERLKFLTIRSGVYKIQPMMTEGKTVERNRQIRKNFDFRTHPRFGMVSVVGGTGKGHFYVSRAKLARTLRRFRRIRSI